VSSIFGPVRQTAYIVRDIERAMDFWLNVMGIGPFFYLPDHRGGDSKYRDRLTDMRISLAFAQSGPIQVELIQQLNDAPSLFKDFIDSGREGLQHLAFWTDTFDADIARYIRIGYRIVQAAGLDGPNNRNAFLVQREGDPLAIEISETNGTKGELFRKIAEAANGWNGTNPIRLIGSKVTTVGS
jgi:hypothetical protein